jgi:hypothetical protein
MHSCAVNVLRHGFGLAIIRNTMLHDSIKEKCVLDIYSYLIEEL